jgi:hypothetical protein
MKLILALVMMLGLATTAWAAADVSWRNPAGSTATGIKVLRGTGPDPVTYTQQGATLPPTATSFSDQLAGVAGGTRVCFKIVPTNAVGDASSTAFCGTTPAIATTPEGVADVIIIFRGNPPASQQPPMRRPAPVQPKKP